jgi:hypothetical protein
MNKTIYGLALALVLGSTYALSAPGDGSCQQHPNAPYCQGEGGGPTSNEGGVVVTGGNAQQKQAQGQAQQANATATGTGVGFGGSASASGGRASANAGSVSEGSSANSNITIVDDNDYEVAASSAAAVYTQACQSGASGQVEGGGFSVVNPQAFCDRMRAAYIYRDAYLWELEYGNAETCAEPMSIDHLDGQLADTCVNAEAEKYLGYYYENLNDAMSGLEWTEEVAVVDSFFGYLIRPIAVIATIILLL